MNSIKTLGLFCLLLAAGCQTPSDVPTGKIVTIEVDGLSCPFCLPGVENNLKSVPGVQGVDSKKWSSGKIDVIVDNEETASDEALRKAVLKSGFTPGEILREGESP